MTYKRWRIELHITKKQYVFKLLVVLSHFIAELATFSTRHLK